LAPPIGSQHLLRWARGHYPYPTDQVPLRTSFKSRQGAGYAPMCCHGPYSTRCSLSAKVGSEAATCHVVPDPASLLGMAPMRRVFYDSDPASLQGWLRRCHASCGSLWAAGLTHKENLSRCHTRFLRPKSVAYRMYAQDQFVIHTVRM
jgi:hypothetical protein